MSGDTTRVSPARLTLACLIAFSQWLTKKLEAREAKKEVQA